MADHVMFSPAVINLQMELASGFHPTLCQVLALCKDNEEKMSVLATHCDIAVDDQFNEEKFDDLCDSIAHILKEHKREAKPVLIVTPSWYKQ